MLTTNAIHDPQTRQTIVRLLSSMGSAKEINQYLKRFSQLDAARFAIEVVVLPAAARPQPCRDSDDAKNNCDRDDEIKAGHVFLSLARK